MAKGIEFKKVRNLSLGLFLILLWVFTLFHTNQFVHPDQEFYWWSGMVMYSLLLALTIGMETTRNYLFNLSVWSFFKRFILFLLVGLIFWSTILQFIPAQDQGLFSAILVIPLWLLFIHAFVFATIESVVQIWLESKIGRFWTAVYFGLMHWGVWFGGALIVIPAGTLLFLLFSYTKLFFAKGKSDLGEIVGMHTSYNYIKILLGF